MNNYSVWFHVTKNAARGRNIYLGNVSRDGAITWAKKEKMSATRRRLRLFVPEGAVLVASGAEWDNCRFDTWHGWFVLQRGQAVVVDKVQAHEIAARPALESDEIITAPAINVATKMLPPWLNIHLMESSDASLPDNV